jgi:hypothetical protein
MEEGIWLSGSMDVVYCTLAREAIQMVTAWLPPHVHAHDDRMIDRGRVDMKKTPVQAAGLDGGLEMSLPLSQHSSIFPSRQLSDRQS